MAEQTKRQHEIAVAELAAEQVRQKAIADAEAEQERRLGEPRWAGPLISALLCSAQHERVATSIEIAKEKRLAREVGVVNLKLMGEYQDTLRDCDERILSARRQLTELKVKPMSCSNRLVSRIEACHDDHTCDAESSQYELLLARPEDFASSTRPGN